ncbi:hypothetical protein [Iodobacter sp.]|uniref:hypothetical protein n=1 Tax=Iodobacter sp. TaxID=1915058 RepID=UPI0025F6E687|nr:hypothetical protein [Iodobacter sp.]
MEKQSTVETGLNVIKTDTKVLMIKTDMVKRRMLKDAKYRAELAQVEFTLELDDFRVSKNCPIFKRPYILGDNDYAPSLDRIVPSIGYVKSNVVVVSSKANRMKNNGTADDLKAIAEFYKGME